MGGGLELASLRGTAEAAVPPWVLLVSGEVGASLATNFVSGGSARFPPRLGSAWTSKGGCPYIYFFASLFSLTFVFLRGTSLLDAVERPRQKLALGRPGRRRPGLHKQRWATQKPGCTKHLRGY